MASTSATGALLWREDYTPFGEARQQPAANDNDEGYTGHINDSDTGIVYMQARYYDPAIGRFLSQDPVGFASGGPAYFNRYAYVGNNPLNATDPTGEVTQEWVYTQSTGSIEHHQPPEGTPPIDSSLAGNDQWASNEGSIETTGQGVDVSDLGQARADAGWTVEQKHVGYSGNGQGLNNPAMESVQNVGPIPAGEYDLGATYNSPNVGPNAIVITPDPGNNAHGRTDFRVHGDNSRGNQSASNGCIIAPRAVRNEMTASPDRDLRVVDQ